MYSYGNYKNKKLTIILFIINFNKILNYQIKNYILFYLLYPNINLINKKKKKKKFIITCIKNL
jgi:hypothetical protein